jgi:hypothetical protein
MRPPTALRRSFESSTLLVYLGIATWWFGGILLGSRSRLELIGAIPFLGVGVLSWWTGRSLERRRRERAKRAERVPGPLA